MTTTQNSIKEKLNKMLDEFISFCNNWKLSYFLDGGSLLGAVREHHLIDWDDDIDIVMPRRDFKKLVRLKDRFKYPYKLVCYSDDCNYYGIDCMLVDRSTCMMNEDDVNNISFNVPKGLHIDICSFEHVDKDELDEIDGLMRYVSHHCVYRHHTHKKYNCFLTSSSYKQIYDFMNAEIDRIDYANLDSDYVTSLQYHLMSQYRGLVFKKSCYVPFFVRLEGVKNEVSIPKGYDAILKAWYNDYMTPRKNESCHEYDYIYDTVYSFENYYLLDKDEILTLLKQKLTLSYIFDIVGEKKKGSLHYIVLDGKNCYECDFDDRKLILVFNEELEGLKLCFKSKNVRVYEGESK